MIVMVNCEYCGGFIDEVPRKCSYCNHYFCSKHRLPELHKCSGLKKHNIYDALKGTKIKTKKRDEILVHKNKNRVSNRPNTKNLFKRIESHIVPSGTGIYKDIIFLIKLLIVFSFLSNLVSPIFLTDHNGQKMQYVIGNPKPLYFYDVSPSCRPESGNIKSSLDYFASSTSVKFVKLPYPLALIAGGVSYSCNEALSNTHAIGEADSGSGGTWFFILSWNNVKLLDFTQGTIIHETLHTMGFGHSNNQKSIMYPYKSTNYLDSSLISYIHKHYVSNPFSYLNILTMNLISIFILIYLFMGGEDSSIFL